MASNGYLDQTFGKKLNDFICGSTGAPTLGSGRKLKLLTSGVSATNAGTEITVSGGYTSGGVTITFAAATLATPSEAANNAVTITNMPAVSIGGFNIMESGGTRLEYGYISKTTVAGDTLTFSAGSLIIQAS